MVPKTLRLLRFWGRQTSLQDNCTVFYGGGIASSARICFSDGRSLLEGGDFDMIFWIFKWKGRHGNRQTFAPAEKPNHKTGDSFGIAVVSLPNRQSGGGYPVGRKAEVDQGNCGRSLAAPAQPMPSPCGIDDFDLCMIFVNAQDNAINACRSSQGAQSIRMAGC